MARIVVLATSAPDAASLGTLLSQLGHEAVSTIEVASIAALVCADQPDLVLLSSDARSPELRALVKGTRAAAERPLPLLLALPESAWWHRVPPAIDLAPLAIVRRSGLTAPALRAALERLQVGSEERPRVAQLTLDATRRQLEGPRGAARLTPAEGALAALLLSSAGQLVQLEALCAAIWGSAVLDSARATALRTHVHTLRGKLKSVGLGEALVTEPGRGYRLAMS